MTRRGRARPTAAGIRFILAITLVVFTADGGSVGQALDEYQMKAAFLYNFAKFVEWPADSFRAPTDPIVSCVLGESPFSGALERAANGRAIGDRTFLIRHILDPQEAASCQILFISSTERRRPRAIFKAINRSGILTVGEADVFISEGGIANFKVDSGKIRIQINVEAAERQGLRISPKLLSLAQIVRN